MINDTRRDAIFEEMNSYTLALDPSATGPRYFIDKIAVCRNYLNSVSIVLSELQREKLVTTSELHKLQAIVELESARLLSTDEHVRRLANIKDRESMVAHILRDRRQRTDQLKDQLQTIDGLLKHVSLRNRELHATMDAIKNQRRFMHIEVQTGAFYGDERLPAHERSVGFNNGGVSADFGEAEIRKMIEDSSSDDAVAEMTAALDEAAQAGGPVPVPIAQAAPPEIILDDVPPVSIDGIPIIGPNAVPIEQLPADLQEHLLSPKAPAPAPIPERPLEPAVVPPEPPQEMSPEDNEALRAFLGDGPATPPTVEPSKSGAQAEIDDFSFLLDTV